MKIISKILIFLMLITILSNIMCIFNYTVEASTYSDMMEDVKKFTETGKKQAENIGSGVDNIIDEFVPLGQLLTTIGAGVLIAVTTFMGIKYITSGPDAQAKLKQQLIGVIVSGIVIFGAYGIWQTVGRIVQNFEK